MDFEQSLFTNAEIRKIQLMHHDAGLDIRRTGVVDHQAFMTQLVGLANQLDRNVIDESVEKLMELKKSRRGVVPRKVQCALDPANLMNLKVWTSELDELEMNFDYLKVTETVSKVQVLSEHREPVAVEKTPIVVLDDDEKQYISASHSSGPGKLIPTKRSREENDKSDFMTAKTKLLLENQKNGRPTTLPVKTVDPTKRDRSGRPAFVSPLLTNRKEEKSTKDEPVDPLLKNLDPLMIETITNEIMSNVSKVSWDDIAGLAHAKRTIKEIVVFPMLRPDIFTGIRSPPKGMVEFTRFASLWTTCLKQLTQGTGKTMIGKCIASQCNATFFSISSSSLTSKWVGEGEKMVRTLFAVARTKQPAVIFIDEIDSLLTQRTDGEQEATRRIKTEFLVQFDGCGTNNEDRILMIGATNRPHEIDEAARRRFRKKLYIPLPEEEARRSMLSVTLQKLHHALTNENIEDIIQKTAGYSGSDMDGLIREAALGPIRDITDISTINADDVRAICHRDFIAALSQVKASVSDRDLELYKRFEVEFGSMNT